MKGSSKSPNMAVIPIKILQPQRNNSDLIKICELLFLSP